MSDLWKEALKHATMSEKKSQMDPSKEVGLNYFPTILKVYLLGNVISDINKGNRKFNN